MLTMVSLMNRKYIVFFKKGEEEKARQFREDNPEMKYARIDEIIQARPSVIIMGHIYERLYEW